MTMLEINKVHNMDCLEGLKQLDDNSIDCCVTSPPYWGLRDYGVPGQIGLEETPREYVDKLLPVFREVRRVLKPEGTLWLNLGDSYAGSGKGRNGDGSIGIINSEKQKSNAGSYFRADSDKRNTVSHNAKRNRAGTPCPENLKPKDLIGIPWRVAFALQDDGWYLRMDNIWNKPNPMPESVTDRPTKAHEYIFLMAKSEHYYYDGDSIKEPCVSTHPAGNKDQAIKGRLSPSFLRPKPENSIPADGRNKRSVWTITTQPTPDAHFATFPEELAEICIKAGCPGEGIVLDPFMGSGTTGLVATQLNRQFIGFELNPGYIKIANKKIYSSSMRLDMFQELTEFQELNEKVIV